MNFQCSRFCRGRREEGTRGSKREPKQHTKNTTQITKPSFFSRPRAKPPKKLVKTAKKAPPGGHNDPQERPRRGRERPKRSQDPKSVPRAQEPPRGGLGAALVATWGRSWSPPGRPFGPLGGGFWPLRGSLFKASSASCGALRGAGASANAEAQAQAQSASAGGQEPRTAGSKAAKPQGLGGPAGCAGHLNSPGLKATRRVRALARSVAPKA